MKRKASHNTQEGFDYFIQTFNPKDGKFFLGYTSTYSYGFNGMMKDNDIYGQGNAYTTEFREIDPRLGGRWWSIDPKDKAYESPYVGFSDNPVLYDDPSGDTPSDTKTKHNSHKRKKKEKGTTEPKKAADEDDKNPNKDLHASPSLKDYLKSEESYVDHVYDDKKGPKSDWYKEKKHKGHATIGYGHKLTGPELKARKWEGQKMSEGDADNLLDADIVTQGEEPVKRKITTKVNQQQFDALVDYAFHAGEGNLAKSNLPNDINKGTAPDKVDKSEFMFHNKTRAFDEWIIYNAPVPFIVPAYK